MGQKDTSLAARFVFKVQALLDHPLGLALPDTVLDAAARRAFEVGMTPEEAAIRICHEHARLVTRNWVEKECMASDLAEFVIASRLDECAALALKTGSDLIYLLPELPDFVHQPCFSPEFREMVGNIAIWHGFHKHHWGARAAQVGLPGRAIV